jgi:hypothetical protein
VADVLFEFGHHERVPAAPATPARAPGAAPTVCQCRAPEPCTVHPDDAPWVKLPPVWVQAHPESPVGRTDRRMAEGESVGEHLAPQLTELTDAELHEVTVVLLAEHTRRARLIRVRPRRMGT